MERLTFKVDGVDYSPSINRYGYSVGYEKRTGNNGGTMLDGSETVDILAWKAVLTLTGNAMPSEKLAALLTACMKDYVQVTFFDVKSNGERTASFIPDIGAASIGLIASGAAKWFREGIVLTLREK